ncbi:hypothetical protein KAT55_03060, partial [Candidatus Bathyarchaeota archaeon]|nr:hypothetical protein [Candidatus Bathyarchaeota archaeon]
MLTLTLTGAPGSVTNGATFKLETVCAVSFSTTKLSFNKPRLTKYILGVVLVIVHDRVSELPKSTYNISSATVDWSMSNSNLYVDGSPPTFDTRALMVT